LERLRRGELSPQGAVKEKHEVALRLGLVKIKLVNMKTCIGTRNHDAFKESLWFSDVISKTGFVSFP
jgi:hypothetical protein